MTQVKHFKMRNIDVCLSSEGTEVILATSSDEKHPPENIIDGNPETFWTTTGMFPQEFIICFHKHVRIERLLIQSYFVRTLRIEKSTSKEPVDFEQWIERDLVHTEGQLQNEEIMDSLWIREGCSITEHLEKSKGEWKAVNHPKFSTLSQQLLLYLFSSSC
ncbi:intraflagellar transport protein 25 homolog isoform X3 [Eschrichtius robustus]|uniref:intraflagellar transport protein 25 homolog isoform X3 n=1 Tax=Eschrichtius robustus TaxID=9764 RepID=UPI0035C1148B